MHHLNNVIFFVILGLAAGLPRARAADITADPVEAPIANLVQVVAPHAKWAAVDAGGSILAFAHHQKAREPGEISIFGLDAQGNIVGTPGVAPVVPARKPVKGAPKPANAPASAPAVALPPAPLFTLVLPRPDSLKAYSSSAQCLLFHPKLPLLYVWQDIAAPAKGARMNIADEFDHLLIYSLAPGQPPRLELATAHGPAYWAALTSGTLALDAECKRLALPNLRSSTLSKALHSAVGYVELDDHGMPRRDGEKLAITSENLTAYGDIPAGMGFVFVSETVAIVESEYGPISWDLQSRNGKFGMCYFPEMGYGQQRLLGHPTLPVIYLSGIGTPLALCMEHADGYLTLLPQRLRLNSVTLASPPVLLTKRNELALGGAGRIYIVKLDENGGFAGSFTYAAIGNPTAEAMAYSAKFDRLYVAVDKAP